MKSNKFAMVVRSLFIFGCFVAASAQAAVVNLTFTEDINGFTSTWRIDDNGGGDFSGSAAIAGTNWQVSLLTDASAILQDTIGHVLGPHGEDFLASSVDYGALPLTYFEQTSFVVHGDGHEDTITLTSDFVGGGYNVSIAGFHAVPIPAAVWLFGSGLGLLGWMRRKQVS
jgi:hypothetical protein